MEKMHDAGMESYGKDLSSVIKNEIFSIAYAKFFVNYICNVAEEVTKNIYHKIHILFRRILLDYVGNSGSVSGARRHVIFKQPSDKSD